ncbi:hypothetical protein [Microbacterium sp. NPDC055455]
MVVNTLGGALAHYTRELVHDLEESAIEVEVVAIDEPSQTNGSSLQWLRAYIRALRFARRLRRPILVTWPLLGYIDLLILRVFAGRRGSIVVHDPRPLVAAYGYGRLAQAVGALVSAQPIIVHSIQAQQAVENRRLRGSAQLVAHPMLRPIEKHREAGAERLVRVLGQFKPDRDLDVLRDLGSRMSNVRREVVGRRWPKIDGWSVRDEFVPESELAELLTSSDAVLVPYRRFFQSGIAIRCLEVGTPVVGPTGTSMDTLLGVASQLLAADDWVPCVEFAVSEEGLAAAANAAAAWYIRAVSDWKSWAQRQGVHSD